MSQALPGVDQVTEPREARWDAEYKDAILTSIPVRYPEDENNGIGHNCERCNGWQALQLSINRTWAWLCDDCLEIFRKTHVTNYDWERD